MDGSALQLAMRELRRLVTSPTTLGGMAVASVVLTVAGPFGTFVEFDAAERFAYWTVVVVSTYLVGNLAVVVASQVLLKRMPAFWPRILLASAIGSVPVTLMMLATNAVFYQSLSAPAALQLFFYVLVVTLTVTSVLGVASRREREVLGDQPDASTSPRSAEAPASEAASEEPSGEPAILGRMPPAQRGPLIALIVTDHYVEIVTARGKAMVLMRLADAIRETAPVDGLQIHRSHWVARAAVSRSVRRDGRVYLELSNGMALPVSRSALPALREAGWA